jgi:hypothetical protein
LYFFLHICSYCKGDLGGFIWAFLQQFRYLCFLLFTVKESGNIVGELSCLFIALLTIDEDSKASLLLFEQTAFLVEGHIAFEVQRLIKFDDTPIDLSAIDNFSDFLS